MARFDYDQSDIHATYREARRLPAATLELWLDALAQRVPADDVGLAVDVGCGTGRFCEGLARRFSATVYAIDPSERMLSVARRDIRSDRVKLVRGVAESMPLPDGAADLAFLSVVYHHLHDRGRAAREFRRVLGEGKWLAVRPAVRERLDSYLWLRFFPAARPIEFGRTPATDELTGLLESSGFGLHAHTVVRHPFAGNLATYAEKIGMRGLSSLKAVPDEDFHEGMAELKAYCTEHDTGEPVREDIDLFVFRAE
jgi:ubiquinone/menaquinone biosynthesis C-methylase UbiE